MGSATISGPSRDQLAHGPLVRLPLRQREQAEAAQVQRSDTSEPASGTPYSTRAARPLTGPGRAASGSRRGPAVTTRSRPCSLAS